MQFALIACVIGAVKIIDAVGHVRCLLNFSNQKTFANGMHPTCWQKEHVILFDILKIKDFSQLALFKMLHIGLPVHRTAKS